MERKKRMGKTKKIIFAGLDNGGKTSIILTLQKKFTILGSIRPTLGLNRSNMQELKCLGMDLIAWDFGGQKNYRDSYFAQRFHMFNGITTAYYVIDIQDDKRFEEALTYLKDIFETIQTLGDKPQIIICFNKFDPGMETAETLEVQAKKIEENITAFNPGFEIAFFRTSIFDPGTLIKAFSEGILKGSPKAALISGFLKEYAKVTFSSAVILLDENSLIMGSHYTKKRYLELIEMVSPRFISAIERLEDYQIIPENVIVNLKFMENAPEAAENEEKDAMIFLRSFQSQNGVPFTIVTLTRNKNSFKLSDTYLHVLANQLSEFMTTLNQ
jgi:hypothetical protein